MKISFLSKNFSRATNNVLRITHYALRSTRYAFLLFLLTPINVHATDLQSLYRDQKYSQIIELFKNLHPAQHNEESLYYLALAHMQKKQYDKAKEILTQLLAKDPDFYTYRIQYDLELAPVLNETDLKSQLPAYRRGILKGKRELTGHELVQTETGLVLYRNGIKLPLTNQTEIPEAGFIDDDLVFYLIPEKQKKSVLYIYAAPQKRVVVQLPLEKPVSGIRFKKYNNQLVMQGIEGYVVFERGSWRVVAPWVEGGYVEP